MKKIRKIVKWFEKNEDKIVDIIETVAVVAVEALYAYMMIALVK